MNMKKSAKELYDYYVSNLMPYKGEMENDEKLVAKIEEIHDSIAELFLLTTMRNDGKSN